MAEQQISNEELEKLQKKLLDMAKVIKNIFEENQFKYFILGGTLLGAVRHKGFIPWDDDFDFVMPRKDYEQFLQIIDSYLPDEYGVIHYKRKECQDNPDIKKVMLHSAKIIDLNSYLYTEKNGEILKRNVFIDIIPLDGIPNGKVKEIIYRLKIYIRLFSLKIARINDETYFNNGYIGNNKFKKFAYKTVKALKIGKNRDSIAALEKFDKTLAENDYNKCNKVSNILGGHGLFKETFYRKDIEDGKSYNFEDTTFIGPQNYNVILTKMYGSDYNIIPPENSPIRQCKHSIKIEISNGER